jgi:ABC-2 type transport system ATP-binding protein
LIREEMKMAVIEVENLVKTYGDTKAVDGISFAVEQGEIFGIVGPNGAGKTTTVEIIEGLRRADSGIVKVLGLEVERDIDKIKERMGIQLQTTALYPNLTVWEMLDLFGSFFPEMLSKEMIIEQLNLAEKRNALSKNLSGGQLQRLSLALALINDPDIIFLDEPTTGLDPQARRSMWGIIEKLKEEGKTVLLTTHYMEEAEKLCDRVAVMDYGHILDLDEPEDMIKRYFKESAIQFEINREIEMERFQELPFVNQVFLEDKIVTLYSSKTEDTLAALMNMLSTDNLQLSDIHIRRASLEDVFLKLTGRRIRD